VWAGLGWQRVPLVPHHNGPVNPALVKMAAAYDPDYVVTAQTIVAHSADARFGARLPCGRMRRSTTRSEPPPTGVELVK